MGDSLIVGDQDCDDTVVEQYPELRTTIVRLILMDYDGHVAQSPTTVSNEFVDATGSAGNLASIQVVGWCITRLLWCEWWQRD